MSYHSENYSKIDEKVDSFFDSQFSNQKNTLRFKKHYINIDSSKRIKKDRIISNKINTIDKFVKSFNNHLDIIILDPYQINKKKIVPLIEIIFRWVGNNNSQLPPTLFGINSNKIIFNEKTSKPIFFANLINYNSDTDRAYYRIADLTPRTSGLFGSIFDNGFLEIRIVIDKQLGYVDPNQYTISLGQSFKNIVSLSLVSTIFPQPVLNYLNINNINYTVYLHIRDEFAMKNIVLDKTKCLSLNSTINNLVENSGKLSKNYNLFPLVIFDTSDSYFDLYFFKLDIPLNHIHKIRDHNGKVYYDLDSYHEYPIGTICLIVEDNIDIFMVEAAYTYEIISDEDITIGDDHNIDSSDDYEDIYLNDQLLGILINISKQGDQVSFQVTTDKKNPFGIGDIIHTGNHNISFTISSVNFLGRAPQLLINKVNRVNNKGFSKGFYTGCIFNINYNENCVLNSYKLFNIGTDTISITNYPKEYTVDAKIIDYGLDTLEVSFNSEYAEDYECYQILEITDQYIDPDNQNTYLNDVLLNNKDNGTSNTRLFLGERALVNDLYKDQYVKVCYKDKRSEYKKILDIDRENRNLIIDDNFTNKSNINYIRNTVSDLKILNKGGINKVIFKLNRGVLRGESMIAIDINPEDIEKLRTNYIIQIARSLDDIESTNSELNIIDEINLDNIDDGELLIKLRNPLSNSWLANTIITQLYLYLDFERSPAKGEQSILVDSDYDLEAITKGYGVINWQSYTMDDEGQINYEEPIKIINFRFIDTNIYELDLEKPLENSYNDDQHYLVLFLDYNLLRCEPSTKNFFTDQWYTEIFLEKGERGLENILPGLPFVYIYGMKGENIPIYSLSSLSILDKNIAYRDIDFDQDIYSNLLSIPLISKKNKITSYDKNFNSITIQGRYSGRGGNIRLSKDISNTSINTRFNYFIGSKIGNESIKAYISKNNIPKRLTKKNKNVKLKIRPYGESYMGGNYNKEYHDKNYFYICTPGVSYITDLNNNEDDQIEGWCFSQDNFYKNDRLMEKNNNFKNRHNLKNILNKINIVGLDGNNYFYDSFVNINPPNISDLRELNELSFSFLWEDGRPVDFNQKDHSFVIEIVEADTNLDIINSRMGQKMK